MVSLSPSLAHQSSSELKTSAVEPGVKSKTLSLWLYQGKVFAVQESWELLTYMHKYTIPAPPRAQGFRGSRQYTRVKTKK